MLVCRWWWFDWSFACLIAPVVTITNSIILSLNKTQNGVILVPAYPGFPGKWQLNKCCFSSVVYYSTRSTGAGGNVFHSTTGSCITPPSKCPEANTLLAPVLMSGLQLGCLWSKRHYHGRRWSNNLLYSTLLYSHFNITWKPSCSSAHSRTFFCS